MHELSRRPILSSESSYVFDVRVVPKRCRSLTSKSPALKRRNQNLQVLWDTTPSPSTEGIDLHASTAIFLYWNS
uniref:Uncharacterized protein n=1 Tax=Heterorhabditis bacteriophora TaxID=37862 RepID=A0A1I7X6D1_HETBA